MIHNSKLIECAGALHRIEFDIDMLKISLLVNEFYDQQQFISSKEELLEELMFLAISKIQDNVKFALQAIDFQTIEEIKLEHRAMLESNSRSGDEKSAVNSSDG